MRTEFGDAALAGYCDDRFDDVATTFAQRFSRGDELGAAICVYWRGQKVVDLWGGCSETHTGAAWDADTSAILMSTTKGLVYACIHLLASRRSIELHAPIARYWPEFAANGKATITIRELMAHQAGIPAIDRPLGYGDVLGWEPVVEAIAAQEPVWPPGSRHGYHPISTGWALSEIIRRVDGRRAREFFVDEFATPLSLNLSIGNCDPARKISPVVLPSEPAASDTQDINRRLNPLAMRVFSNPSFAPYSVNDPEYHALEIPSGNGIGDARSVAKLYASLLWSVDGLRLLDDHAVDTARIVRVSGIDEVVGVHTDFCDGFMAPGGPLFPAVPKGAFGHAGMGGSAGFADPETGIAFGYVMNRLSPGLTGIERSAALVRSTYSSVARV